jgi:hypothetical protein
MKGTFIERAGMSLQKAVILPSCKQLCGNGHKLNVVMAHLSYFVQHVVSDYCET